MCCIITISLYPHKHDSIQSVYIKLGIRHKISNLLYCVLCVSTYLYCIHYNTAYQTYICNNNRIGQFRLLYFITYRYTLYNGTHRTVCATLIASIGIAHI